VDWTNGDMVWNGSANVRCECEDDEGTECADGDSDIDWLR
jgi:hypothetical protein